MSINLTITQVKADGQGCIVFGTGKCVGNYVAGGDTADFTKATQDPAFVGPAAGIPSSQPAQNFDFWDVGGNIANGVQAVIGTTLSNNKVKFTSAFNTELAAGAYPAAITGSTFNWQATFAKNI